MTSLHKETLLRSPAPPAGRLAKGWLFFCCVPVLVCERDTEVDSLGDKEERELARTLSLARHSIGWDAAQW